MIVQPCISLTCPIDGSALTFSGASVKCVQGHAFDVAREGYVNLLPVQSKASLDPGDSKEMVTARRRFLQSGSYEGIARTFTSVIIDLLQRLPDEEALAVLDAGCGEGYFLQYLGDALAAARSTRTAYLCGVDISKWAVRAAAKRACPATWIVATNKNLPVRPHSIAVLTCLFGFPNWQGFARVLRRGGYVVLVDPGPDHLIELRRIIYPTVNASVVRPIANAEGYRLIHEIPYKGRASVSSAQLIADLLAMTPHAHRVARERRDALAALATLSITVDVSVRVVQLASDL